ncbi:hypothetical protein LRR18_17175, partial [Mangrovimonas sp. AS39]|uniref:hypothetical protein n=1 Tax=Mangrovimonas futianensis TaxID=2895523 RepID=UPI001E47DBAC
MRSLKMDEQEKTTRTVTTTGIIAGAVVLVFMFAMIRDCTHEFEATKQVRATTSLPAQVESFCRSV